MIAALRPSRTVLSLAGLKVCVLVTLAATAAAPLPADLKHAFLLSLGVAGLLITAGMIVLVGRRLARAAAVRALPRPTPSSLPLRTGVSR